MRGTGLKQIRLVLEDMWTDDYEKRLGKCNHQEPVRYGRGCPVEALLAGA